MNSRESIIEGLPHDLKTKYKGGQEDVCFYVDSIISLTSRVDTTVKAMRNILDNVPMPKPHETKPIKDITDKTLKASDVQYILETLQQVQDGMASIMKYSWMLSSDQQDQIKAIQVRVEGSRVILES